MMNAFSITILILLCCCLLAGNLIAAIITSVDYEFPNLEDKLKYNFYTIPLYPGMVTGLLVAKFIEKCKNGFDNSIIQNFHKFMLKNPLDLIKFRIRIEKK